MYKFKWEKFPPIKIIIMQIGIIWINKYSITNIIKTGMHVETFDDTSCHEIQS